MAKSEIIHVNDSMQADYSYRLTAEAGQINNPNFNPAYSPAQMLELGVFEGKYLNDCVSEFPCEWFENAKISNVPDPQLNHFGVKSRSSLAVWRQKGWIVEPDPRGWFQWYCRYYLGRRLPAVDSHQFKRWRAFARHAGQVRANCDTGDVFCRPRQRQALLQWSHDPFI